MDRKQDSPHIFPSLGLRTNRGSFHSVLEQKRRRVVIKRDKQNHIIGEIAAWVYFIGQFLSALRIFTLTLKSIKKCIKTMRRAE